MKMLKSNNYESNLSKILDQLQAGKRITSISVLMSVGTTEIRKYISEIRKTQVVHDVWIKKGNKQFKEYFL